MIANILLSVLFATLLYISYLDIVTHRIGNVWVVVIACLFAPYAFLAHMPLADIGIHLATGSAILIVGFVLFSFGLRIGGGDMKLFAALSLWCGVGSLLPFFVVMCLVGGAIAVLVFALRQVGIPEWLAAHDRHIPALALDAKASFVPYAPAMTLGFIFIARSGLNA